VAGLIYSRGMDQLAYRISRTGVTASVDTYLLWQLVANQAIGDYHDFLYWDQGCTREQAETVFAWRWRKATSTPSNGI